MNRPPVTPYRPVRPDQAMFESLDDFQPKSVVPRSRFRCPQSPIKSPPSSRLFKHPKRLFTEGANNLVSLAGVTPLDPIWLVDPHDGSTYLDRAFIDLGAMGEGCFGEVRLVSDRSHPGEDPDDELQSVVKISSQMIRGSADRKFKVDEARIRAKFGLHPHLVTLLRAWEERGRIYLQLEYCPGGTLESLISEMQFDEPVIWRALAQMTLGLLHIHRHDCCHFDLKPSNILIGSDEKLKIGDFGLARMRTDSGDFIPRTEGDAIYLAPEFFDEDSDIGQPADVFALGLMVFEMASNFDLPQHGSLYHKLRSGEVRIPSEAGHSDELSDLCYAMMARDPLDRPTLEDILSLDMIQEVVVSMYGDSDPFPLESEFEAEFGLIDDESTETESSDVYFVSADIDASVEFTTSMNNPHIDLLQRRMERHPSFAEVPTKEEYVARDAAIKPRRLFSTV